MSTVLYFIVLQKRLNSVSFESQPLHLHLHYTILKFKRICLHFELSLMNDWARMNEYDYWVMIFKQIKERNKWCFEIRTLQFVREHLNSALECSIENLYSIVCICILIYATVWACSWNKCVNWPVLLGITPCFVNYNAVLFAVVLYWQHDCTHQHCTVL